MYALGLILFPYLIFWLLTRSRRRSYRLLLFVAAFTIQMFSLLPLAVVGYAVLNQPQPEKFQRVSLAGIYDNFTITQRGLHGLVGWEGVDIAAGCGSPIYAPFDGTVTFNGRDGYNRIENGRTYEQATMLTIKEDDLELTLLHGDYFPQVGSQVKRGDPVGTENKIGWVTGCHSHVILKQNGISLNYLDWVQKNQPDYPLRISWFDPSKCYDANGNIIKNTNCDSDPTTMASGDKVATWLGGKGGLLAAACPRSNSWYIGKRFELDGVTYECRDTGGWINCYQSGMYDPALKRQAEISYCWVDLLNGSQYSYGSLAYDWGFLE